ncbi:MULTISPECIES: lipid II:glycine glycyltransferase FemX [unclassified Carboxylicivirga]|uniref:lipid II:glycine glycyltransferase FemX n=1 Tax=Carboxylicivirga TaxID=1628153 RepID=UPI003D33B2BE
MSDKYTVNYLEEAAYGEWDQYVASHPLGTPFQLSTFLKQVSENTGRTFRVIALKKGDEIVGGFAFGEVSKLGFKMIPLPYDCPVFQPLFNERDTKFSTKKESHRQEITKCLNNFLQSHYHAISFRFDWRCNDLRSFSEDKFSIDLKYTYIQNLNEFDASHHPIDPATKRQIKKAHKEGFTVNKDMSDDNIAAFYALIRKTYKRQGLPLIFSQKDYQHLLTRLVEQHKARLYVMYIKDEPVAAMAISTMNKQAHYWLSASDTSYSRYGGTSALILEVLNDLKMRGIESFDFVGANTASISRFKAGYSFNLQAYYEASKTRFPLSLLLKIKSYIQ